MVLEWLVIAVLLFVIVLLLLRKSSDNRDKVQLQAEKLFEEWQRKEMPKVRKQAIKSSEAVTLGKSLEHLLPYFPDFPYNPKDARFMGSPVDLVVFDGLSEGNLQQVVFIEVKTGKTAHLPKREQQVKSCIEGRQVRWQLIHYKQATT